MGQEGLLCTAPLVAAQQQPTLPCTPFCSRSQAGPPALLEESPGQLAPQQGSAEGGTAAGWTAGGGSSVASNDFRAHWNCRKATTDKAVMVVFMVVHFVSAVHNRHIYFRTHNLAFTLAWPAAVTACLRWMAAAPGSYAHWREVPAMLLPLTGCLSSVTWEISQKTFSDVSMWQEGRAMGAVLFWSAVIFGSMIPNALVVGLAYHTRLAWHCAAQALYAGMMLRNVPDVCESPLLQLPASKGQIEGAHAALRAVGTLFVGRAAMSDQLPAGVQCRGLLSTLILILGFALPTAFAAACEKEEYARFADGGAPRSAHQPQQRSWGAAVSEACLRIAVGVFVVMLTLVVWDACVAFYLHKPLEALLASA